ncbi:hypothetical protein ACSFC1_06900 [Pseudothermotoga sp. U03pept]|uniref:hypothetical protein n=1 Tax=Pseudothermotoga sp. U03pept TaxID=3447012 RepID=UPI003F057C31
MRIEKFLLITLTVFAFLFLMSFQAYRSVQQRLNRYEKLTKAYELYCLGKYEEFSKYVDQHRLKELSYLLGSIKDQSFQKDYLTALKEFNLGNFASAAELFKKALAQIDRKDTRYGEVLYYLSLSLANGNRFQEAKIELANFLDLEASVYRERALLLLIDLYKKTGELSKAQQVEKILQEVKK